jgi:predicted amidohydrolase YtcJ
MLEKRLSIFVTSVWLVASAAFAQTTSGVPAEIMHYADTVYFGGPVLTVDNDAGDFTIAQAIAVRDGHILAVGPADRILQLAGPNTKRIDLKGRAIIPGIINTHIHPNRSALRTYRDELKIQFSNVKFQAAPSLTRWDSKEQVLDFVKRACDAADPKQEWIGIAGTVRNDVQLPGTTVTLNYVNKVANSITATDLDAACPGKAVVISTREYHGLASSRAIEIMQARYGKDLGGIVKDANGRPTGLLLGGIPIRVVEQDYLPEMPAEILATVLGRELQEQIAPQGITTWSSRLNTNEIRAYMQLDMAGKMPLRLAYGHEIGRWNPLFERDMRWGMEVAQGFGNDKIWLSGISIGIPDGQPGSYVCSSFPRLRNLRTSDAYPDSLCQWDIPGDNTRDTVRAIGKLGYRVSNVHSYGDGGLERALQTFEEIGAGGKRFALDHSQLFNPRVIEKGGKLKIYFSLSPAMFAGERSATVAHEYGEEVASNMLSPVKALLDAGARVTFEGEFEESDPMEALEVFVTRKSGTGPQRGLKHAVDRKTALRIMTRWGAEYVLREDRIGSLEPGKLADLVVLDRNPLDPSIPDDQLGDIDVMMTIVGGNVVYDSGK